MRRAPTISSMLAGALAELSAGLFATATHAQAQTDAQAQTQPSLVVHGDTQCPSAEMIRASLVAAQPDRDLSDRPVTVDVTGDRLSVTLGEAPAARREIPADRDCAVRAASVALVIAAWSGELTSRPSDSPVLIAASPPSDSPGLSTPSLPLSLTAIARPTKPSSHVIELDGSAFYSPVWGHEPGMWLGVARVRREGGVGVRLLGGYQGGRDIPLEGGTNGVQRFLLGAAVTYNLQRRYLFASGDLGLVGALTHAQGAGYESNRGDSIANVGGLADLRGGLRLGDFHLWANARVLRFVRADTVKIQSSSPGVADSSTLSAWDAQLGVGVGYRFE